VNTADCRLNDKSALGRGGWRRARSRARFDSQNGTDNGGGFFAGYQRLVIDAGAADFEGADETDGAN
jgi:hypothetical protein